MKTTLAILASFVLAFTASAQAATTIPFSISPTLVFSTGTNGVNSTWTAGNNDRLFFVFDLNQLPDVVTEASLKLTTVGLLDNLPSGQYVNLQAIAGSWSSVTPYDSLPDAFELVTNATQAMYSLTYSGNTFVDGIQFFKDNPSQYYGFEWQWNTPPGGTVYSDSYTLNNIVLSGMGYSVPEPSIAGLSLLGLTAAAFRRRR